MFDKFVTQKLCLNISISKFYVTEIESDGESQNKKKKISHGGDGSDGGGKTKALFAYLEMVEKVDNKLKFFDLCDLGYLLIMNHPTRSC
jgi:hypothetical protein